MKRILTFLILPLLFHSCVSEISIDYPDSKSLLTLNCVLRPGDPIRATLFPTQPFDAVGLPRSIKDGQVYLYEDGILVDSLAVCENRYREASQDTIWFYCSSYPITATRTYRVEAKAQGFPKVWGQTTIPLPPKVINVESKEDNNFGDAFEITIEDTENRSNYFLLQLRHVDEFDFVQTTTLVSEDPTINIFQQYAAFQLPTDQVTGSVAFFDERFFNGGQRKIRIRTLSSESQPINEVLLISAAKEYYDYRRVLEINNAVGENPFAEPVRLKSNVEEGFGIVGSDNISLLRFR